jgi:hypothetical protein
LSLSARASFSNASSQALLSCCGSSSGAFQNATSESDGHNEIQNYFGKRYRFRMSAQGDFGDGDIFVGAFQRDNRVGAFAGVSLRLNLRN